MTVTYSDHNTESLRVGRLVEIVLRVANVNRVVLRMGVVGAINIGLEYLNSNGGLVVLGSTGACGVWWCL